MRKNGEEKEPKIRQSRFPVSVFWIILGSLLLISGIHTGLYLLLQELQPAEIVKTHIILLYWLLVSLGLTFYIRYQMKKTYEKPLQDLSQATKCVAQGDFSVYIPTTHTADKLDYLDRMILDMNKMIEELGSIETLKTDFISNVSHEMKTPLAVIKNYAEMLQMENVTDERRMEYARSIEESARKMSELIGNILKLNKLENQTIVPEVENYDVCRQLCDCILGFEDVWEGKNIDLEVEMEDASMICADASLMELVWNNLLSNAVKFTDAGGQITVKQSTILQDGEPYVQVAISDTGCGISETALKRIFDKFYQGDTSHVTQGNGLGLALVHRVLTLLGGSIYVESEEGKGSTFVVKLAAAEKTAEIIENPEEIS